MNMDDVLNLLRQNLLMLLYLPPTENSFKNSIIKDKHSATMCGQLCFVSVVCMCVCVCVCYVFTFSFSQSK